MAALTDLTIAQLTAALARKDTSAVEVAEARRHTGALDVGEQRVARLQLGGAGADVVGLLAVQVVQIAVGIYQARNGLPPLAVGVHMVLASLTAATMTVAVLKLKRPASDA